MPYSAAGAGSSAHSWAARTDFMAGSRAAARQRAQEGPEELPHRITIFRVKGLSSTGQLTPRTPTATGVAWRGTRAAAGPTGWRHPAPLGGGRGIHPYRTGG